MKPPRRIAINAGKDGSVILNDVLTKHGKKDGILSIGYDVIQDKFVNMVKSGIIDPAKVTRGALENAASIAAVILTTEALITDMPEEPGAPAGPPMPDY